MKLELQNHSNLTFVDTLVNGLTDGFHTGNNDLPSESFECRNSLNARKQPEAVTQLINDELNKGFVVGPFNDPPFHPYRINPLGIAEGKYSKKLRLVVDLSAPHNNEQHRSMNELIDKEQFSVNYVRVDDAIKVIKKYGTGAMLNKTDIVDAFKLLPIHPSLWKYHGVCWDGKYYFFTRLCFGSRSSPKIFTMLSEAIHYIATHNYHIQDLLYLLDDFLTVSLPADGETTMSTLKTVFRVLNIPIHPKKTLGPATFMTFLGINLDTVEMQASLPHEKVERISKFIASFIERKSVTKRELQCILGHLNFASTVIIPGRSFVSYLLRMLHGVKELHHYIYLNAGCRDDLLMWTRFLDGWNGKSFFYDSDITTSADMELYTDASGSIGYGGYFQGKWFACRWPQQLQISDKDMSIAFMELVPIVTCAVIWGSQWCLKRILFHCDNMATVFIVNKGRSQCPNIMKLMRKLTLCAAKYNFIIHAVHIEGKLNYKSDYLSRFQMTNFRKIAPNADPHPTPTPLLEDLLVT